MSHGYMQHIAEFWSFGSNVSPRHRHFGLRVLNYSCDMCLQGLRFTQYIYCLEQIREFAPLARMCIDSLNKKKIRSYFMVFSIVDGDWKTSSHVGGYSK